MCRGTGPVTGREEAGGADAEVDVSGGEEAGTKGRRRKELTARRESGRGGWTTDLILPGGRCRYCRCESGKNDSGAQERVPVRPFALGALSFSVALHGDAAARQQAARQSSFLLLFPTSPLHSAFVSAEEKLEWSSLRHKISQSTTRPPESPGRAGNCQSVRCLSAASGCSRAHSIPCRQDRRPTNHPTSASPPILMP
jgi:hypothetical protein